MIEITLSQFTPAQAEKITGVSVVQQRNLRRHGYLPSSEGHARFDVFGLARLLAIHVLSSKGMGPARTVKGEGGFDIASICAKGIVWKLLHWVESYEGDHWSFQLDGPPVVPLAPEIVAEAVALAEKAGYKLDPADLNNDWSSRSDRLRKTIFTMLDLGRVIPVRFLVWWADDQVTWEKDLMNAFGNSASDSRYFGACTVIDQDALAATLSERAGVAFAHIEEVLQ